MSQRRARRIVALACLCTLFLCTSCLGPGHATARLYNFNRDFESKWAQEGMFVLLLPAYLLTSTGDNLIFNSVQWWTGDNPINPPEGLAPSEFGL